MPTKIQKIRSSAFARQAGRCHYCRAEMWQGDPDHFVRRHGLTRREAMRFMCTAEHLQARCEGGKDAAPNIVAACLFCNRMRHARARPLNPERYKAHVARRLQRDGWHGRQFRHLLAT